MISITTPYLSAKILLSLDDFEVNFNDSNSDINLMATATFLFLSLWVVQLVAFCIYSMFSGEIFGPYKHRVILGRHTMDTLSMLAFSYMGWEALNNFGGFDSIPTLSMPNGTIASVGAERAYLFSAAAQRLCIAQVAYEIKNFCDSVIHNDGAIFLVHHTVTCLLSALSCRPFLHIYCAYFLGWSEISTAILCVLVLFDQERGIPPLAKAAPMLMKLVGGMFASTFIIFRVILWPYVNYYFWTDMLHMIENKTFHNDYVPYIFMFVNVGLTVLQFFWLGEIIQTGYKVMTGDGELAIKRGDDAKSATTKKLD